MRKLIVLALAVAASACSAATTGAHSTLGAVKTTVVSSNAPVNQSSDAPQFDAEPIPGGP